MVRAKTVNTDIQVAALKAGASKYAVSVKGQPGLYVRVSKTGAKSFAAVARDPHGRQVWATIGGGELDIDEARDSAREAIKRIKAGLEPFPLAPAKADSFATVAESWYTRHVKKASTDKPPLRSAREIRRRLDSYILPAWVGRDFTAIKKSDVAKLLDSVEDNHGATQADRVLSDVRAIMRWHAARDDEYVCVVTGKLRRTDPSERRRHRHLDDAEIRIIWQVASNFGTYGDMVRLGILTGQRLSKIADMRWRDVTADGHWHIATEAREKGNGDILPLPVLALGIVKRQKRIEGNSFVFAGRDDGHYRGQSKAKARLDEAIAKARAEAAVEPLDMDKHALPDWDFHDTRRTARSLLARAGVSTEIAKKVLGHADDTIQATYNRHSYIKERGEALEKLAGLVALILDPPAGNVKPMKRSA